MRYESLAANTHLIKIDAVKIVDKIPKADTANGTTAHGSSHCITSGLIFLHPVRCSFGAKPGLQDTHVSLLT